MSEQLPGAQPVCSVSDFIAYLNQTLEYAYPSVEVEGEVASFKVNQGKYVFFDLKDADGTVGCFMMVWQLRTPIEEGMKVIVTASPKLTPWGKFSLTVRSVRPSGEGALKKSFELLHAKLSKEGLFALERKRQLPALPRRIGVISSTQAAGYADFIKILGDRWGGVQVDVAHVQVQGTTAPDQIIRALKYFNEQPDLPEVLVIIRGGGSADDLAAFNDELLVREIAASRIPTLVGVGHETDETLADLVADVRAATPSNAAQLLVPDRRELQATVRHQLARMLPRVSLVIEQAQQQVRDSLLAAVQRIELHQATLARELGHTRQLLAGYDPQAVLRRGYALLRGEVAVGRTVEVETAAQIVIAEVTDVRQK